MLTQEIKAYIEKSVLCWLATSSAQNIPNVSPKEIFTYYGDKQILIANIASPQSIRNIRENANVCISFIDILVQKGYQLKGKAELVKKTDSEFAELAAPLEKLTEGKFPFSIVIKTTIEHTKPIIAPKYILYPETTEEQQIESAIQNYNLQSGIFKK